MHLDAIQIDAVPATKLTQQQWAAWSQLQESNRSFDSPYFTPQFTQAVATVRPHVRVGIIKRNGLPVGFFPFQKERFGYSTPVGHPLSDFHGVVVRPETNWNIDQLLQGCGITIWEFDHLYPTDGFSSCNLQSNTSPYMDLTDGFQSYCRSRRSASKKPFSRLRTLARKLERQIGPMRFEFHVEDTAVLQQLLTWKRDKYREWHPGKRTWLLALLERIHTCHTSQFAGVLSVLYAGDVPIAAHFGMRSREVWHYWFPAYRPEFSSYCPGHLLLLCMAEAAESVGVTRIDLGKGAEAYKSRFMSGALQVAKGCVALPSITTTLRNQLDALRSRLRSRHIKIIEVPGKLILRAGRSLLYRSGC